MCAFFSPDSYLHTIVIMILRVGGVGVIRLGGIEWLCGWLDLCGWVGLSGCVWCRVGLSGYGAV